MLHRKQCPRRDYTRLIVTDKDNRKISHTWDCERFVGSVEEMTYRVEFVYPGGKRKLCGGVKSYKLKKTAEAAKKHYEKFIDGKPAYKGVKVELTEL